MHYPLRLHCDMTALQSNYRELQRVAGTPSGAAVKADGYGLGATQVVKGLWDAGCRDFFVATWAEAEALDFLPGESLAVLHGLGAADVPRPGVRPVLSTVNQIARWKSSSWSDQICDVMIDTGMNRLGIDMGDLEAIEGLKLDTLHSHLSSADEDSSQNLQQLDRFREIRSRVEARRYSLANSAGIFLGQDYSFDLVRPGLSLYGGIPRDEAREVIRQVVRIEAEVLQCRDVLAGEKIGYNGTFTASEDMRLAVVNAGYADGYPRSLSSSGTALSQDVVLPVVGRVSMDLVIIDVNDAPWIEEGDWLELAFDLESVAKKSGRSQYELLTGLGRRFERSWDHLAPVS